MTDSLKRPVASVTRQFQAPPEAVFDAWLQPELVRLWMAGAIDELADGKMEEVTIDAREGGSFTFSDWRDGELAVHRGTYLEIDRPRKLVFTWLPEPTPPDEHSLVTITIESTDEGCTVTLVHEMEPQWADYVDRTEHGWASMLDAIAAFLA